MTRPLSLELMVLFITFSSVGCQKGMNAMKDGEPTFELREVRCTETDDDTGWTEVVPPLVET